MGDSNVNSVWLESEVECDFEMVISIPGLYLFFVALSIRSSFVGRFFNEGDYLFFTIPRG